MTIINIACRNSSTRRFDQRSFEPQNNNTERNLISVVFLRLPISEISFVRMMAMAPATQHCPYSRLFLNDKKTIRRHHGLNRLSVCARVKHRYEAKESRVRRNSLRGVSVRVYIYLCVCVCVLM
jgi:hypothetical protein